MYTCNTCKRKFASEQALGGHRSHAHPDNQPSAIKVVLPAGVDASLKVTLPTSGEQASPPAAPASESVAVAEPAPEGATAQSQAVAVTPVSEGATTPQPGSDTVIPTPKSTTTQPPSQSGAVKPETAQKPPEKPDDESTAHEIEGYAKQGYTVDQLTKQLGFELRSVRRVLEKLIPPAAPVEPSETPIERTGDGLPAVRKGTERLNPEAILRSYMVGDGDAAELRGIMKMRAAMLLVAELIDMRKGSAEAYALEIKPILDLMKETRAEQDAAAERAKASSLDTAKEAAREMADQLLPFVDDRMKSLEEKVTAAQKKPDIASTAHPMEGVMARMMETMSSRLMGMFGLAPQQEGQSQIPGFTYKKKEVPSG